MSDNCAFTSGKGPPLRGNEAGAYVALLCWLHSKTEYTRNIALFAFLGIASRSKREHLASFFSYLAARGTVRPTDCINRLRTNLLNDETVDEKLHSTFFCMDVLFQDPGIRQARAAAADMPLAVLYATQRQVCSGKDEEVWAVLRHAFELLG